MHSNHQYTKAVKLDPIETLARGYKPRNVTNVKQSKFKISETSEKTFDVIVSWEPADDRTCHYHIYSYDTKEKNDKISPELIKKVDF